MRTTFHKGFSLVELLVSISIVTMIMTVVLFGYSTFNDNLALSAAGQELAIAVRQTQSYGLNVKEVTAGSGLFSYAYGIYFDPNTSSSDFYIFVDANNNKVYDVGSGCGSGANSTECVEKISLRNNVTIYQICDASACPPSLSTRKLDITFLRPNTDANIYFTDINGTILSGPVSTGKVRLISPKGKTLTVEVQSTGQISIQ